LGRADRRDQRAAPREPVGEPDDERERPGRSVRPGVRVRVADAVTPEPPRSEDDQHEGHEQLEGIREALGHGRTRREQGRAYEHQHEGHARRPTPRRTV
jgi:hypothetical protein